MKSFARSLVVFIAFAALSAEAQQPAKGNFVPIGEDSVSTRQPANSADTKDSEAAKSATTSDADAKKDEPQGETINSAVNVIRRTDRTEVMFRNGEVYYLPSGSKQAAIYAACEESEKTGKAISIVVNPRSRVIQSVGGSGSGNRTQTK